MSVKSSVTRPAGRSDTSRSSAAQADSARVRRLPARCGQLSLFIRTGPHLTMIRNILGTDLPESLTATEPTQVGNTNSSCRESGLRSGARCGSAECQVMRDSRPDRYRANIRADRRLLARRGGPAPVTERAFENADEAIQVRGGEVDHGPSAGAGTSQPSKTMNPLQTGGSSISASLASVRERCGLTLRRRRAPVRCWAWRCDRPGSRCRWEPAACC